MRRTDDITGQEIALMIENGITNDGERETMGHSLYYYC